MLIPIQFFVEIFSLNNSNPINVEQATMATLLMVNNEELSKPSTRSAFNRFIP